MRPLCLLLVLVTLAGCAAPSAVGPRAPQPAAPDYWPTNGWRHSTPEAQGMDSKALAQMFEHIAAEQVNLHSVLIVRNGYLVTEAYFHPYTAEVPVHVQSLTKSVVGALVGIAIDQGKLASVDEPVVGFWPGFYFTEWDDRKGQITLKHLLSMSSGLDCQDFTPSGDGMYQVQGWIGYMLQRPMAADPGTRFSYCGGSAHLLSAVLERATGTSTRMYANQELFAPLGIAPVPIEGWWTDPQNRTNGSFGLHLTPLDLAKLGLLYLQQGRWESQQVVPADWVAASTQPYVTKEDGSQYGYLWTVYSEAGRYAALGMGEQHIHVVPGENLVVIFTAGESEFGDASPVYRLLLDHILPAIRSDKPITENASAAGYLSDLIAEATRPVRPVPPLPELAGQITGRQYALDENPMGWTQLGLRFEPGAPTAQLDFAGLPTLSIGLDNVYRSTEVQPGVSLLLRGRWEGASTFVIDYPYPVAGAAVLGELGEHEIWLAFTGDAVDIAIRDVIFDSAPLEVHGSAI